MRGRKRGGGLSKIKGGISDDGKGETHPRFHFVIDTFDFITIQQKLVPF